MSADRVPAFVAFLIFLWATQPSTGLSSQATGQSAASAKDELLALEPGKPVEREITEGQTHSYRVRLAAGEFLHVFIYQRGVNVAATLLAPDGKKLFECGSTQETEWITHIPATPGEYKIEVGTVDKGSATGPYQITIEEQRRATPQDEDRIAAQRAFAEASRLFAQKVPESYRKAVEKYKEALALYRRTGRQVEEAATINCIGQACISLHEYKSGIEYYEQALASYRRLKDPHGESSTLNALASASYAISRYEDSIRHHEQALAISREVKDRISEGRTLNNLGEAHRRLSRYEKAMGFYEQALVIALKVKDRKGEGDAINNLGSANLSLGRYERGIEYYERALVIRREVLDRAGEGVTLNALGAAHNFLALYDKAIEHYERALAIRRELKDRKGEGDTLTNLASTYYSLGQNEKAIDYYERDLVIAREVKDRWGEGGTLQGLGIAYLALGRYEKAIEYSEQALVVAREVKNRNGEGNALFNLGYASSMLNRNDKAIDNYGQTLAIAREVRDRRLEGFALNNLGEAYASASQYQKATNHYEQALAVRREIKDRRGEGRTLNGLAYVCTLMSRYEKAIEYGKQSLTIAREVKDRSNEADTLDNLGEAQRGLGQYETASEYYEQALNITREMKMRGYECTLLNKLMLAFKARNNASLAIVYGKQAVNMFQEIRGNIKGLDKASQQSYLKSKEDAYRKLADLLISQGRLSEAEKVLELLKEEEFNRVIRRNGPSDPKIDLTRREAEAATITDRLALLAGERGHLLAKIRDKTATDQDLQRLDLIEATITEANKKIMAVLAVVAKASPNDQMMTQQSQSMMQSLRRLGTGAVALYTVVTTEKGWVILTTPDFRRAYPINTAGLNKTISDFRLTLKSDRYDPVLLAQKLYTALFLQKNDEGATLAADLKAYRARTLMWSLDGVLRYVPVGALHDGKGYLVERYPNLVFTTASLTRLLDAAQGNWRAFGLGVSKEFKDFPALTAVPRELRSIIRETEEAHSRGVLPGVIRLDEKFTRKSMIDGLREGYPVVHIASHFRFNAEREETSFLLLGDGTYLSLEEMQNSPGIFERVELLTLSACDTATVGANGKEMEGLAFVAQDLGAKAVVASLWPVADEGTEVLMREFYRLKRENPHWSKAEALRQAQMSLLKGKASGRSQVMDEKRGPKVSEAEGALKTHNREGRGRFAHPHYWAPFILIGNWK